MGLTALKGKKSKKKIARAKVRTGANAAPIEQGLESVQYYFQNEVSRKDAIEQVKTYVKNTFSKQEARYILSNPEYKLLPSYYSAATAFFINSNLQDDKLPYWQEALQKRMTDIIESGKVLYNEKQKAKKDSANVITLSPAQRLQKKISNTIMQDLLELEDDWIDGKESTINLYDRFKFHGLAGSATLPVRGVVEGWLLDYEDAYHKRCDQAVEGYSHLKRSELNRRIKACNDMLSDLDSIKAATKASRTIKVRRPKSADKQVAKVKFKKEDNDFKVVSINPVQIVGKTRLYTFNAKHRELSMFYTDKPSGFEISGSTIKYFDKEQSIKVRLRKPMDILPLILDKTPNQIQKELSNLSVKVNTPNGRLNEETLLLRVLDK